MAQFPALPLWTDAYLGDTTHLTTIEHGTYILLLMAMWRTPDCSLSADDRMLARYARLSLGQWTRIKPTIMAFFRLADGRITQGRLTDEANLVRRHSKLQSDKARSRWLKNNDSSHAAAMPNECRSDAPTPTPTVSPLPPKALEPADEEGEWVSRLSDNDRALALVWRATGSHDDQIRAWLTTTRGPHRQRIAGWMRDGISANRLPGIVTDILDRCEGSDGNLMSGGKPIRDIWAFLNRVVPAEWAKVSAADDASLRRDAGILTPSEPWAQRVVAFRTKAIWLPSWGPPPGEPGCRVPAELITTS